MDEDNLPHFPRYGPPVEGTSPPPERPAPPAPPAPPSDDRERRLAALRTLAGHTPDSPAEDAAGAGTPTRTLRRALVAALVAVTLVVGSLGVFLHSRPAVGGSPPPTTPAIPSMLTLNAATGGVACPTHFAWSPDGRQIAVLAQQGASGGSCAGGKPVGLVFDTRTGHQLISLDLASQLTIQNLNGIIADVTWSPDGTSVLFGGLVGVSTPTLHPTVAPALFSFAADGSSARLLVGTYQSELISANDAAFVWDVSVGRQLAVLTSALPPANSYRWTDDGKLLAAQPLSTPTASAPTGSLAQTSDGTFSAWQAGTFTPIQPWDTAHDAPDFLASPLAEGYIAITNQWSPDGRYVAMGLRTQQLLPPDPGRPQPKLNPNACNTAGFIPPRNGCPKQATSLPDATLASIAYLARIGTHFHGPNNATGLFWSPVPVAWRADGAQLATILPDDGFNSGNQEYIVSIFKTDQTEPAARLSLSCPGMPCRFQWQPGNASLAWSPAGTQLALLDPDSGLITIWGGSALPK